MVKVINRLLQSALWTGSRKSPKGVILMYHRIDEVRPDPWALCVTPHHFAEHLEILRKFKHPLHLQQCANHLRKGKVPQKGVCITFDDGYVDNLYNAKPLLERYDIPATVFLTTGYIGSEREFWWDELERLLLHPRILPETLELEINRKTFYWELGEAVYYSEDFYERDRNWKVGMDNPSARHSLFSSLYQLLQPLKEDQRQQLLYEVRKWAGAKRGVRQTHRSLSVEEMTKLAQGELVEIGSHTVSHPNLSKLPMTMQQDEIKKSKAYIEQAIGRPVTGFAYPYGFYTMESVTIIREVGYQYACTTSTNFVERNTDIFQLPRVSVEDWDGEEFERRLSMWFDKH